MKSKLTPMQDAHKASPWWRNVLDAMIDPLFIVSKGHHVLFANRSFGVLFPDYSGRHCYALLFHRDRPCEHCPLFKVLEGETLWRSSESEIRNKKYALSHSPVTFTDSRGMLTVMHETRLQGTEAAGRIEQDCVLSQLVYRLSSELSSPISFILGISRNAMEHEGRRSDHDRRALELIEDHSRTALELIEEQGRAALALIEDLCSLQQGACGRRQHGDSRDVEPFPETNAPCVRRKTR